MDKLAEKMAELAEKFGPDVINAVRGATKMEAISTLAGSFIALAFAIAFTKAGLFLWNKNVQDDMDNSMVKFFAGLLLATATIPAAFAVWAWLDPWTWTAIFNPDLYIAKKIFKL